MTRLGSRVERIAYFTFAPLVGLVVLRRALTTWFLNDDFGWMGLIWLARTDGWMRALFAPKAQGTIRVFSERVPFLLFPHFFGMNPWPYRALAVLTWLAALTLVTLIGQRLMGSRTAALIAAVFWTTNANLTRPLAWASDYNELLCVLCIVAAFYARLRGWTIAEWAAYLFGFGVLEIIVVYPALAALHALCLDRKKLRGTLPLFIPAIAFSLAHFILIPKAETGGVYDLVFDRRMGGTLLAYLNWTVGPARLYEFTGEWRTLGPLLAAMMIAALILYTVWRTWRRDYLPLFCCGWFLITLAPLLPLPEHVMDYCLTTPLVGFAWLCAAALRSGWRAGIFWRLVAVALGITYLSLMIFETGEYTQWFRNRSLRMKTVVQGVERAKRQHPDSAILLQGVDEELFQSGFEDDPFRLMDVQVYLTPGSEQDIHMPAGFEGMKRWTISPRNAYSLLEQGKGRVMTVVAGALRDVTPLYMASMRADPRIGRKDFVDVRDPLYAPQVGPEWYKAEGEIRWMPQAATVKLAGPNQASQKLVVTGYAPRALLAAGPVTLTFRAGGVKIGSRVIKEPDAPFSLELPLPAGLMGQNEIQLRIEVSKTYRPPGDGRELGMAFQTFAVR
jgi:hypothetical protein